MGLLVQPGATNEWNTVTAADISFLFVPASRPDRFVKALQADADNVIIDLEDAVAVKDKDTALEHLIKALKQGLSRPVFVRINAADTQWFERDILAIAELSDSERASLSGVLVPKAEAAGDIVRVVDALGAGQVIALIESVAGVAHMREIARTTGVTRLAVGAADLSFDLDVEISSSTIDYVYAQMVVESRLAGIAGPVASPPFSITDLAAVAADAIRLRGLGVTGQLAIHPAQLESIHRGFRPNAEQVAWARKIIGTADGASQVDGQMVDKPVQDRAGRILAQIGE
ncbi:MAG: HpcH/HpaI aldolase/citrate lyase family protein [Leucobacter sp.]